ncbi:hypothetical protein F4678DRAFT_466270 [Xylaria arbuscula]|nr:hypothetical protein F4678DRAFT_466270 [Xylaria arbuscula]
MAQPTSINTGSTNNNQASSQRGSNREAHALTGEGASGPIALETRAPAEFIPTRIWRGYINSGHTSVKFETLLEQKVHCIRSQRVHRTLNTTVFSDLPLPVAGASAGAETVHIHFPYSSAFQKAVAHEPVDSVVEFTEEKIVSFECGWFGITRSRMKKSAVPMQPTYVVLGIFRRGHPNPKEEVVFVPAPKHLFRKLHWAAFRLRGFGARSSRSSMLGGLGYLKFCDAERGTHERIELDKNGVADLQLFFDMYKKWHVSGSAAMMWADWIYRSLNNKSNDITKGTYGVELVLGWSITRISIVVLLPVFLSLAIGIYLNAQNWFDLATIQTAWGTASYVVTTGGLVAALLAILSSIEYE